MSRLNEHTFFRAAGDLFASSRKDQTLMLLTGTLPAGFQSVTGAQEALMHNIPPK